MTDHAPRPDDEIVSAHLDGEATPDEAARVTADPAAQDRLASFAAVQARIAGPVRPTDAVREAALAAALDAFDQERSQNATDPLRPFLAPGHEPAVVELAPETTGVAPVVDLAARRSNRNLRLLSAAAAVLVLFGVLAALRVTTDRPATQQDAASPSAAAASTTTRPSEALSATDSENAPSAGPSSTLVAPSAGQTPTTGAGHPVTTPPVSSAVQTPMAKTGAPPDLGALADRHDLRLAVAGALGPADTSSGATPTSPPAAPAPTTTTAPSGDAVTSTPAPTGDTFAVVATRCDALLHRNDPEISDQVLAATATYQGHPALVLAYRIDPAQHPTANGTLRIYVVAPLDCSVILADTV